MTLTSFRLAGLALALAVLHATAGSITPADCNLSVGSTESNCQVVQAGPGISMFAYGVDGQSDNGDPSWTHTVHYGNFNVTGSYADLSVLWHFSALSENPTDIFNWDLKIQTGSGEGDVTLFHATDNGNTQMNGASVIGSGVTSNLSSWTFDNTPVWILFHTWNTNNSAYTLTIPENTTIDVNPGVELNAAPEPGTILLGLAGFAAIALRKLHRR